MPATRIRRVAIVGVGLVGGSIGLALRRTLRRVEVVGIDRAPVLRRARRRGAIQIGHTSLARGLEGADLIILALPVDAILTFLPRVARLAGVGAVVTDIGSTKGTIKEAAIRSGLGARFVGGHPMAGSEQTGVAHADGRLFLGAPWILCASRPGKALRLVRHLVSAVGARPILLDARRHDRLVALFSHLPQILSIALVNTVARRMTPRSPRLAGPAFRQMSRVATSPERLWRGILSTNQGAVCEAIDAFTRELGILRSQLPHGLKTAFRRAARARPRLAAQRGNPVASRPSRRRTP